MNDDTEKDASGSLEIIEGRDGRLYAGLTELRVMEGGPFEEVPGGTPGELWTTCDIEAHRAPVVTMSLEDARQLQQLGVARCYYVRSAGWGGQRSRYTVSFDGLAGRLGELGARSTMQGSRMARLEIRMDELEAQARRSDTRFDFEQAGAAVRISGIERDIAPPGSQRDLLAARVAELEVALRRCEQQLQTLHETVTEGIMPLEQACADRLASYKNMTLEMRKIRKYAAKVRRQGALQKAEREELEERLEGLEVAFAAMTAAKV